MSRFAVLLYPSASLQEITCLTAALSVWYGESIDYIAGEDKEYRSEEGLRLGRAGLYGQRWQERFAPRRAGLEKS